MTTTYTPADAHSSLVCSSHTGGLASLEYVDLHVLADRRAERVIAAS